MLIKLAPDCRTPVCAVVIALATNMSELSASNSAHSTWPFFAYLSATIQFHLLNANMTYEVFNVALEMKGLVEKK